MWAVSADCLNVYIYAVFEDMFEHLDGEECQRVQLTIEHWVPLYSFLFDDVMVPASISNCCLRHGDWFAPSSAIGTIVIESLAAFSFGVSLLGVRINTKFNVFGKSPKS